MASLTDLYRQLREAREGVARHKAMGQTESTSTNMGKYSKKVSDLKDQIRRLGGDYNNALSQTSAGMANMQKNQEDDFLTRFRGFIGGLPSTQDIYARLRGETGLGEAQNLATGLTQQALTTEGTLQKLPEQITSETRGYDVNAAQKAKIEEARRRALSGQLTEEARAAERAGVRAGQLAGDVSTTLGFELSDIQRQLAPFEAEAKLLSERLAREVTMYTANLEAETDRLIEKLKNEGQLSQIEANRLALLSTQEDDYERQKNLYLFQQQNKAPGSGSTDDGWA